MLYCYKFIIIIVTMGTDDNAWTLEAWAATAKLTEASIAKLKEHGVDSVEALCALDESDIKELELIVGQRALLRKAAILLVRSAEPLDTDIKTVLPDDSQPAQTTKTLNKDKEVNALLASMESDLLPGMLSQTNKMDTGNNQGNQGYLYDGNCFPGASVPRKKALRIVDFITEDLDVGEEDEEEVANVKGGTIFMKRSTKPKVSEITLPEWIPANARILTELISRREISTMEEVKQYLDYTIKIGDFARENYVNSVMRFDDKFRKMQAEKGCSWDTDDPFLMHNNLVKRSDTKYGQRSTKAKEAINKQGPFSYNGKQRAYDASGRHICHQFQSPRGCRVPGCTYAHMCIVPGCGGPHPSCQHHMQEGPLRPQAPPFTPASGNSPSQYGGWHGASH